jgi:hypothetical protein
MEKSIGELIDELSIVNIKSFFFQEVIMSSSDDSKVADAARKAQEANSRRTKIVKEINEYFKDGNSPTSKTY